MIKKRKKKWVLIGRKKKCMRCRNEMGQVNAFETEKIKKRKRKRERGKEKRGHQTP